MITLEIRVSAKTWRKSLYGQTTFATLEEAKEYARQYDQDGMLINVRFKDETGKIVEKF